MKKKKMLWMAAVILAVSCVGAGGCKAEETGTRDPGPAAESGRSFSQFGKTEKNESAEESGESFEALEDTVKESESFAEETVLEAAEKSDSGKDSGSWLTDEGREALRSTQNDLKDRDIFMGSAFLGYTADYDFPGREEQRTAEFPYIKGLPADHVVETDGDEWFLLVPENDEWTVIIRTSEWAEDISMELPGITLYEKQDGMPVILRCNKSSLRPNAVVLLVGEKGTYQWYPAVDGVDSSVIVNEAVGNLRGSAASDGTGWLYGMDGYWRCDTAKKDNGKKFCYEVKLMADPVSGDPTTLWLSGGDDLGNFYWDGSYVSRGPIEDTYWDMSAIPWDFDYHLNTPDGIRSGTIRLTKTGDSLMIQDLAGDSFFPYTTGSEETFQFIEYDAAGEIAGEEQSDMELLASAPEVSRYLAQGMALRDGDRMTEIGGTMCAVYEVGTDRADQFVVEAYFAVGPDGTLYRQDYLTGDWEKM